MPLTYAEKLKRAIDATPPAERLGREELTTRIAGITEALKGSLGNTERVMLCADRAAFRKALDALPPT